MGMTSIGIPFFHCSPRLSDFFLGTQREVGLAAGTHHKRYHVASCKPLGREAPEGSAGGHTRTRVGRSSPMPDALSTHKPSLDMLWTSRTRVVLSIAPQLCVQKGKFILC